MSESDTSTANGRANGTGHDPAYAIRFADTGGECRVAIKDVIDIAGYPTRIGTRALADAEPALNDAAAVARLRQAGCQFTGKTQLHELAYGVTGLNLWAGTPLNPHHPGTIPGGSSSGSAVVVARGECDFALGTDTGGSIRVPAACCSVFGIKPTFGRISREGLSPAQSSLDCVGPLARDEDRLEQAMQMLAPQWQSVTQDEWKVGRIDTDGHVEIEAATTCTVDRLSSGPAEKLPLDLAAAHSANLTIIAHETYLACASLLETGLVSEDVAGRLAKAADITDTQLADAEEVRRQFTASVDRLLLQHDLLALPTLPDFPPTIDDATDLIAAVSITRFARPFNLSGHPAIAIPLQPIDGRACSLQLVAAKGQDEKLLAATRTLRDRSPESLFSTQYPTTIDKGKGAT